MRQICRDLMTSRGEATGTALAIAAIRAYESFDDRDRAAFFDYLIDELSPDPDAVAAAALAYQRSPDPETLRTLCAATEPPRQELFRRLNQAPGGTVAMLTMRADIRRMSRDHPTWTAIDADLLTLFRTWFNRGFLELRHIDWHSPASVLERLIRYEAVHEIDGWADLRGRLAEDRRCFGFFHPSLADDPLIFVEVALTKGLPDHIAGLIEKDRKVLDPAEADSAIFYSISNCQPTLRGVSFGNLLVKHVVEDLRHELPGIKTTATLSPIPGFADWLADLRHDLGDDLGPELVETLALLDSADWIEDPEAIKALKAPLTALCAEYLVHQRRLGQPIDPVARFHLGNGARLERINWMADLSPRGVRTAHTFMINYSYRLSDIVRNHESFAGEGKVVRTRPIDTLLRAVPPVVKGWGPAAAE